MPRFTTDGEITRQYRRFNAVGTELTVRLFTPAVGDDSDAMSHFQASVTDLFEYAFRNSRIPIWLDSRYVIKLICRIRQLELVLDERTNYPKR